MSLYYFVIHHKFLYVIHLYFFQNAPSIKELMTQNILKIPYMEGVRQLKSIIIVVIIVNFVTLCLKIFGNHY